MNTIADHAAPAYRGKVILTCSIAALAGLLFGLDIGVISGALPFLSREFAIDDRVQETIVSAMMLGAAIGAVLAAYLSWALGRKYSLALGAVCFVVGSLACAAAGGPAVLIGARLLLGLAVGIASFTAPLYLSEIAPYRVRGAMISLYQLMITVGILAAFLSNTAFSYSGSWRWMLGVIALPASVLLAGVLILPRSPRWLMIRGREQEALAVLSGLRESDASARRELDEIRASLRVPQQGLSLLRSSAPFRRSIALGMVLQVMQQLTGINVVMYYAPRIFELAGYGSAQEQMWATVTVGAINVLATFIAIALVDRWGRKPILHTGCAVMASSLGILAALFHVGIVTSAQRLCAAGSLLTFIAGFAMSAGPLVWVLCSEIQPTRGRDFGIAVSTLTNWLANMAAGATFLSLLRLLGPAATFGGYAALNLLFIVVVIAWVPETKGVSLDDIEARLLGGAALRRIGR